MLAIRIRSARSGDWTKLEPLIAGLCRAHGDEHGITRAQFDKLVCAPEAPVTLLVAENDDGRIAGYVCGFPIYEFHSGKTKFRIQNIFVAAEFRRNRIGEALLISIQNKARNQFGAEGFGLGVENGNIAAISLYRQMGFSESDRAKNSTLLSKDA